MPPFDFKDLAALLKQADISVAEAAKLFRVSRTALYDWLNEGRGPHQEVLRLYAERQVHVIRKALGSGDLPLKEVAAGDRKAVLAETLKRHL